MAANYCKTSAVS